MVFHFIIFVLIHSIFSFFSWWNNSTFLDTDTGFSFTTFVGNFISYKFTCCLSCRFMGYFFEAFCRASSSVLLAVSNNYFPYLLDRFLMNDKTPYRLTYFFCSWFYRITWYIYLLLGNVNLNLSSISNGLPF